jgi:hypothetical protein
MIDHLEIVVCSSKSFLVCLTGPGEVVWWKNQSQKISWHCPFNHISSLRLAVFPALAILQPIIFSILLLSKPVPLNLLLSPPHSPHYPRLFLSGCCFLRHALSFLKSSLLSPPHPVFSKELAAFSAVMSFYLTLSVLDGSCIFSLTLGAFSSTFCLLKGLSSEN